MRYHVAFFLLALGLQVLTPLHADETLELHQLPTSKILAMQPRTKAEGARVISHGFYSFKGHPVLICSLRDGSLHDVYLVPASEDGKWGKPQLAFKGAPLGDHNPALVYHPGIHGTLLFYHAYPADMKGQNAAEKKSKRRSRTAGDEGAAPAAVRYFAVSGKGLKLAPKAREVTKSLGSTFLVSPNGTYLTGITLTRGEHKGRVVIMTGTDDYGACSLYSDDMGKTWKVGDRLPDKGYANRWVGEGSVSMLGVGYPVHEAENGQLLIYVDAESHSWLRSDDGGHSWTLQTLTKEELTQRYQQNPKFIRNAQPSDVMILNAGDGQGNNSRLLGFEQRGNNMNVLLSYDWGATWSYRKTINSVKPMMIVAGVCPLRPGVVGLFLSETDASGAGAGSMRYATLTLSWLTDGADDGATPPGEEKEQDSHPQP